MPQQTMTTSAPSTQPDPHETIKALAAAHDLQIEEWDTSTLDESLRNAFFAMYVRTRSERYIVVPVGQDPAHRLAVVRALLAHPGAAA